MSTLTVTARGQVTFRKDVLRHLGVKPGKDRIGVAPRWPGHLESGQAPGNRRRLHRRSCRKSTKVATIEEMNEAVAEGWAGRN